jgi:hypothetical protein
MNLLRVLCDPDFLMSGVAMVRVLPRVLRLKPVDGSLFFTEEKRQEFRQRIEKRDGSVSVLVGDHGS